MIEIREHGGAKKHDTSLGAPQPREHSRRYAERIVVAGAAIAPMEDDDIELDRTTERQLVALSEANQRPVVTVLTGLNAGQVLTIDEEEITIGRGIETNLCIDDPGVSRKHARIILRETGYWVEDLASTNGTFVRGKRVERSMLLSGDRIQLGPSLVLSFALVDGVEESLRHRLYEASTRDSLTQAYNRQFFVERAQSEIAHARRHDAELSALMLDIDHFKNLNDTFGHHAGDLVLRVVAAQVMRYIRTDDLLARYGGEEFVILSRATGSDQATRLAERVRLSIERLPIRLQEKSLRVTVSIGVAALAELSEKEGTDDLLKLADCRLYAAKRSGRNRVAWQ
jgi:two-component system, cell cycle response regulator